MAEIANPAEIGRYNRGGHGCLARGKQRGAAEVAESCALCFVISKNLPYYGSKIVAEYHTGPNFLDSQLF